MNKTAEIGCSSAADSLPGQELISSATSGIKPDHACSSVKFSSKQPASGGVLLFRLPSVLQDCILQHLRPLDVISLRLSCRAGLERLRGHSYLKLSSNAADSDCWQHLTTEATHLTLCGAIPTLEHLSNLTTQTPVLPSLSSLVPALSNLVVLVVEPHRWPVGSPVYVTFSSWAHLPQLQLEVWLADQDKLKLSPAKSSEPLMMPALLESPLSCQAQNTLVIVNNSEQPTKVVWRPGVDQLWIVSYGHMQIMQVMQSDLLQGVRQVCIAYPCLLSNGEAGELNIMALRPKFMPLHCSFDAWLEFAEITLEQLSLERFIHCGMNLNLSESGVSGQLCAAVLTTDTRGVCWVCIFWINH